MTAIDVAPDPAFGLRTEQGAPPQAQPPITDGGEVVFGAAFRQSNSVVSAIQYMRNSGSFTPQPDYNPLDDIKSWNQPNYFLEHGDRFVGSQSPAETQSIKSQIDTETADQKLLAANGKIGFIAQTVAGTLDPTMLLPGGVALDAVKGGLTFTKAAVELGKAGLIQTAAQEALLHASQQTRTFEESALNVASGTLLSALIGGGAVSLLSRSQRSVLETRLNSDRSAMDVHAGNPTLGEPAQTARLSEALTPLTTPDVLSTHPVFERSEIVGGEFRPASDLPAYVRDVAKPANGKSDLPRFSFDLGTLPAGTAARLDVIDHSLADAARRGVSVSNDVVEKLYRNNPDEADRLLVELPHLMAEGEAHVDTRSPGRSLIAQTFTTTGGAEKNKIAVLEVAQVRDGAEIVSIHVMPNRTLEKIKGDAGGATGPHSAGPREGAPAAAASQSDFPTVGATAENIPSGGSGFNPVGAAVADVRKIELVDFGLNNIPGVRKVIETTSPMQRLFGAGSVTVRRTAADLAETSLLTKENLEGKVTTAGPAVDREARLHIHQGQVAVGDELSRLFSEYRFGEQKTAPRARAGFEDITGRAPDGKMSFDEFKEAVTEAGRNGDVHEIPQVQMAAQTVRNKIFEPWKKRAIETGLLPEDVSVKTADSYMMRLYSKQAIAAKRPEFVSRVTDWLQADQAEKAQAKERIEGLSRQLSEAQATIEGHTAKLAKMKDDDLFREGLESELTAANAKQEFARKKIEEEIAAWEGKSVAEAKSALKARAKAEESREPGAKRLTGADKAIEKAVKRILKSDRDLSRQELEGRAQQITDRIIGSPDGRLPYDLGMEHGQGGGGGGEQPRGSLAAREFNIPDKTIADFLENDIEHIVASHLRTIVPDVLLTEKFGDTRMSEAFRKINDEYAALVSEAKTEGARIKLEKERQRAIDDLAAVRDRIRGIYGISSDAPMRNAARAMNVLKNYNVLTSMGSAALSSLPDMAGSVLRHGLTSTFNDAWSPFFSFLTRQSDAWQEAGRQYRAMGIAVESVLASRHHALTDTLDTYHPQSRVERTMQWATGKFQFVNLLAPWTDFAKINASMVAGSEILRAVKAAEAGTLSARQLRNLGESGIEPHMAARIAKAFETGGEVRDGVHLPNTADWTDKEARRVFEGAVARDADIAVVTPGQEKPLWMSHPLLSVLGQFKSFTAAATERVLISNLQRRDAQVLQGMIFSMGLGMLSYKLNSLTGGQPVSDKPQDWIKEAVSRGNLLGWFEEANALASKATRGGVDVYRMIGADKPLSRYASRSAMDQILGPTAGKIGGILSVTSAASKPSEWNEADSKALRRLVAGQNTFYLRRMFDQVEQSGNNAFGIEMKKKPENR